MKIKFPKYNREQNLVCKLTDKNIIVIIKLYRQGWTIRDIAEKYDVCSKSIRYWLMTKKQRQLHNQLDSLKYPRHFTKQEKNACSLRAIKRKQKVMPSKFNKYTAFINKKNQLKKSLLFHKKRLKEIKSQWRNYD